MLKGRKFAESKDYVGKVYGKLTILDLKVITLKNEKRQTQAICRCECGIVKQILLSSLKNGSTISCGCRKKECLNMRTTHGQTGTRLHRIWRAMRSRCSNINFKHFNYYGGRGIRVCSEWQNSFQVFYDWSIQNGYSDDLTIDRIDTNKDYEPSNCRWVSMKEQSYNRRDKIAKSGAKGIYFHKNIGRKKRWRATIAINEKEIQLGYFLNLDEAIKARNEAELKYWN